MKLTLNGPVFGNRSDNFLCGMRREKYFDLFPAVLYGHYETPTGLLTNSLCCKMS